MVRELIRTRLRVRKKVKIKIGRRTERKGERDWKKKWDNKIINEIKIIRRRKIKSNKLGKLGKLKITIKLKFIRKKSNNWKYFRKSKSNKNFNWIAKKLLTVIRKLIFSTQILLRNRSKHFKLIFLILKIIRLWILKLI